jgi:hypothetical protein
MAFEDKVSLKLLQKMYKVIDDNQQYAVKKDALYEAVKQEFLKI